MRRGAGKDVRYDMGTLDRGSNTGRTVGMSTLASGQEEKQGTEEEEADGVAEEEEKADGMAEGGGADGMAEGGGADGMAERQEAEVRLWL